ncbi:MAG: hypothetical protein HY046_10285, partial [Acidobacteria bacterium]|nr:hypothetical protein [Acidobacteriota bacterium]
MRNKFIQALVILLAAVGQLQAQAPAASDAFPLGSVIERVECAGAKNHNYALYLPKVYTPEHAWPVMFAFDPGARGSVPVKMMTDLAEKYGFILAGSNTSRNGPINDQVEAADAMMQDVSKRFPLNPKRLYTTGFSGGARIATLIAQLCGDCIAGVFAHGAGFAVSQPPDKKYPFDVFVSIGDLDFNYPELIQLERTLDKLEVANHLAQFSGPHQWAPPEIWVQAFGWLELRGMAAGRIPVNKEFVAQQLSTREELARSLEQKGDLYGAWTVYRKIPGEFQSLAETTADLKKTAALENSIEWKKARKQEQTELDRQATLT